MRQLLRRHDHRTGDFSGCGYVYASTNSLPEQGELLGVSCLSARACTAVGDATSHAGTPAVLAERWNGGSWERQGSPDAPSELLGVSCASAQTCIAAGDSTDNAATQVTLAERWNGRRWTKESTSDPLAAQGSYLTAVSCSLERVCTVVG
ncbi:MAG TPA: hypothetical protein VMU39_23135 [Solirubrobacteraceae bacterium]|nr:hypothetical protein [Solirubrobacteraceae bacterium]